jgi:gliding motility-associated lipoprotein GldH
VYLHYNELKTAGWSKLDTLFYDIDSADIVLNKPLNVQIELANNNDYSYQNLWLFVWDDLPGNTGRMAEMQYLLSDDMGKWYGAGFGHIYQLTVDYRQNVVFDRKRNYRLKIVQGMRDEPLKGIEKVGVKLTLPE